MGCCTYQFRRSKREERNISTLFRPLHYEHNKQNCMETHLSFNNLAFTINLKRFWDLLKRTNDYLLFSTFDVKYSYFCKV